MDWAQVLLAYEPQLRGAAFIVIFALVAGWEWLCPWRPQPGPRQLRRWANHAALLLFNTVLLRLFFPAAAVGMAAAANAQGLGLFNHWQPPAVLAVVLSMLILDAVIYWQHRLFHRIPLLWRLHRVHHADTDYDVTTALRFHPLEILLSMLIKWLAIVLIGPPLVAVLLFEVLLNGMAMFNHANAALPGRLEGVVRWLLVTPDMHRIHHSVEAAQMHSNFGFNLSVWDRCFGSYIANARSAPSQMMFGLPAPREPCKTRSLLGMLVLPFRR